jgi:hypothetical protein
MATPVVRTGSPQKTIQINKNQHKRGTTEFQKTAIPYKQNQSLNADHRSTTVEDGFEVIEFARKEPFGCVFLAISIERTRCRGIGVMDLAGLAS